MWTTLDDGFPDHPKVRMAGPDAERLFVHGLMYCNRLLTDGFIPASKVPELAPGSSTATTVLAERLVTAIPPGYRVGLWEPAEGGFMVHDFLAYNWSRERVLAYRAKNRERQSRYRHGVSHSVTDTVSNGVSNGVTATTDHPRSVEPVTALVTPFVTRFPSHPIPSSPDPSPDVLPVRSSNGTDPSALSTRAARATVPFSDFWTIYPRKDGKKAAEKVWSTIGTPLVFLAVSAALEWQKRSAQWCDERGRFIPHAATYLRAERWRDEPSAAPVVTGKEARTLEAAAAFARGATK